MFLWNKLQASWRKALVHFKTSYGIVVYGARHTYLSSYMYTYVYTKQKSTDRSKIQIKTSREENTQIRQVFETNLQLEPTKNSRNIFCAHIEIGTNGFTAGETVCAFIRELRVKVRVCVLSLLIFQRSCGYVQSNKRKYVYTMCIHTSINISVCNYRAILNTVQININKWLQKWKKIISKFLNYLCAILWQRKISAWEDVCLESFWNNIIFIIIFGDLLRYFSSLHNTKWFIYIY